MLHRGARCHANPVANDRAAADDGIGSDRDIVTKERRFFVTCPCLRMMLAGSNHRVGEQHKIAAAVAFKDNANRMRNVQSATDP